MGVGSGGQEAVPPWIFIHVTDIIDRGLFCYFSVSFSVALPGRGLIVLFFGLFSVGPPENFSADALDNSTKPTLPQSLLETWQFSRNIYVFCSF